MLKQINAVSLALKSSQIVEFIRYKTEASRVRGPQRMQAACMVLSSDCRHIFVESRQGLLNLLIKGKENVVECGAVVNAWRSRVRLCQASDVRSVLKLKLQF